MEPKKRFRFPTKTLRFTGRRGITPMKTKQKRLIPKTRKHKVEDGILLRKQADSQLSKEREASDKSKYGENQQGERHQDGSLGRKREDAKEQTQAEQSRDEQNQEESVHPGTLSTLCSMSEQPVATACDTLTDKTEIEAEVLQ